VSGSSVSFTADGPPAPGGVSAAPLVGQAVSSTFTLAATGWSDEDPSTLTYTFYRFPVRGSVVSQSGAGLVAVPAIEAPDIEWDDRGSENHWVSLGGVVLRQASRSPEASNIHLSSGAYFVVPMSAANFSVDAVIQTSSELTGANDTDAMLNFVNSLSSELLGSGAAAASVEDQQDLMEISLQTLESTATILKPTSEYIHKIGQTVSGLVTSSDDYNVLDHE
ncbi:unnamed protein product, partial [Prorocentrum cordatum]